MSLGKFNMLIGYFTSFLWNACSNLLHIFQMDFFYHFFNWFLVVIYSGFKPSVSNIYYTFLLSFYCLSFHSLSNVLWWISSVSLVTQSCLTLRDPMDCSPPGSSPCGIFQARVLEWGAIGLLLGGVKRVLYNTLRIMCFYCFILEILWNILMIFVDISSSKVYYVRNV